ncbi:MAG: hypothetical protein WAT21_11265 [Saprospiraceae bacterium]
MRWIKRKIWQFELLAQGVPKHAPNVILFVGKASPEEKLKYHHVNFVQETKIVHIYFVKTIKKLNEVMPKNILNFEKKRT